MASSDHDPPHRTAGRPAPTLATMRFASTLIVRRLARGAIALWLAAAALAAGDARATDPPYDAPLVRLAEILGALHYLRPLCGAAETSRWRRQMGARGGAGTP